MDEDQGPWTKYQPQNADEGPWTKYANGLPAPNAELAPPAGAPPKDLTSIGGDGFNGEKNPVAQGLTTMETKLSEMPGAAVESLEEGYRNRNAPVGQQLKAFGNAINPVNLIDTKEGSLPMNIGGTAANLLPFAIDPAGGGIGKSALGRMAAIPKEILPSAERAGATLEGVQRAARLVPVDTTEAEAALARARELRARGGGTLPPSMRAFDARLRPNTSPSLGTGPAPPIYYPEMRDFASASGRQSMRATEAMSPMMKRQLAKFGKAADMANKSAAESVGEGENYTRGMNEYRRAMKMRDFGNAAKKVATRAAIPALVGATGYGLYRELQ